jgi:toxin ParE1/3/4
VTVQFTPTGKAQFLDAIEYIMLDNPVAAMKFRRNAEGILRRLETFPDSGRLLPEFPDLPFREVIIVPYRFFYRREGEIVWIVAVWHSAQLPDEPS